MRETLELLLACVLACALSVVVCVAVIWGLSALALSMLGSVPDGAA